MDELLFIPVHTCAGGTLSLRTGRRSPDGERVGIAFTSEERLRSALGGGRPWIRLAGPALRSMLAPMGIAAVQMDPLFVGPKDPVPPAGPPRPPRPQAPAMAGRR
ncbi:SAV_915 family protein [Spirillospora sp. NBC_01491]|uniref:SAV_915 family protein n=1 Tax=Spirillospora sp. NBC_01491 TaxID=2976007 RepID=UPI002E36CEA1|nr:SAV_915 family protein [Spirillospora sp. NBC_01491]